MSLQSQIGQLGLEFAVALIVGRFCDDPNPRALQCRVSRQEPGAVEAPLQPGKGPLEVALAEVDQADSRLRKDEPESIIGRLGHPHGLFRCGHRRGELSEIGEAPAHVRSAGDRRQAGRP